MLKPGAFQIPPAALALALAGILPFAALAVTMLVTEDVILRAQSGLWLIVYAAVILSFLGGARWGLAIAGGAAPARTLILSVLGALAGWGLVVYGFSNSISSPLLLAAAGLFLLHWIWDVAAAPDGPVWYSGVRTIATIGATGSLLAAAFS